MEKYYGWAVSGGYGCVVKIVDRCEAYIFSKTSGEFRRDDEYLKAAFDPGSDFDEITKEEAAKIVAELSK